MKTKFTEGVHIRLDTTKKEEIKNIAANEHRSFSQQVRHLIELGLKEKAEEKQLQR